MYGRSSGIVGLRLFPNPNFNEKARKNWDAAKYRKDENYYTDPDLVRPYRVGACHAFSARRSASPRESARRNPEAPKWAKQLSTTIGAQYLRVKLPWSGKGFCTRTSVVFHILDSQPPGTVDTSLVTTDQINNANSMNALFDFGARLDRSGIFAHRTPSSQGL